MSRLAFLFLTALLVVHSCDAYRYLVFTLNVGYSHVEFDGRLADALVERGHEVDFVIVKMNRFVKGNGSKLANVIHYVPKNIERLERLMSQIPFYGDVFQKDVEIFDPNFIDVIADAFSIPCEDLHSNVEFVEWLRSRHYDGAFAEIMDACARALAKRIGIQNIMLTSPTALGETFHQQLGLPALASFIPALNRAPMSAPEMTFQDRVRNFLTVIESNYATMPKLLSFFNKPGRLRGPILPLDFPTSAELTRDTTALFLNIDEALDLPRPTIPLIRHVGGIALKEPKELDETTAQIFNRAHKGVVLLSFGSIVNTTTMSEQVRDAFLNAFSKFPNYQFIWKYVGPQDQLATVFQNYSNVHALPWIDQISILSHPKTKAFISHVGLNSLNEAAHYGVPIIAVPFFGDQTYNAAIVKHKGIGIALSKRNLTEHTLTDALNRILADGSEYAARAETLRRMLAKRFGTPKERFVSYVEYATEFPDELRRQHLPNTNFFVYYSLDVILFIVADLTLFFLASFYILKGLTDRATLTKPRASVPWILAYVYVFFCLYNRQALYTNVFDVLTLLYRILV